MSTDQQTPAGVPAVNPEDVQGAYNAGTQADAAGAGAPTGTPTGTDAGTDKTPTGEPAAPTVPPQGTDAQDGQKQGEGTPTQIEATGNAVIDAGIQILAANGLTQDTVDNILIKAFEDGDKNKIDYDLIKKSVAPENVALASQLAESYFDLVQAQNAQAVNAVYTAVGGQAQWEQYRDAFKTHAPDSIQKIVDGYLDAGDYTNAANTVKNFVLTSGYATNGTLKTSAPPQDDSLSKAEFLSLYDAIKAQAQKENRSLGDPRYLGLIEDINRRRQAGIAKGK